MISKLRGRVSSAHVIALAALFVALGGTAFAASKIGTNDIKNQAVTTGRIADQAVTERTLRDQAVTNPKLADSSVDSAKIADSSVTASELGGTTQVVSAPVSVAGQGNGTVSVQCPAGTQVLSGGGGANSFLVFGVESFQSGNGWIWVARNTDAPAANAHNIFATAVCLNA